MRPQEAAEEELLYDPKLSVAAYYSLIHHVPYSYSSFVNWI
jgi:hypothetical protein